MKKLFTSLALAGAFAFNAQAQETAVIQTIILSAPTEINCTDSFEFGWAFVNHGPYTIQPTDTFGFNDYESDAAENGWIGYVTEPVAPGDTFYINVWNSHYERIGWGYNAETEEYIAAPLPVGEIGLIAQFFGFYTQASGEWAPRTDIIHDVDTDEIFPGVYILVNNTCGEPSSIDNLNNVALNLYPNPTNGSLNFSQTFNGATEAVANVYDITGKVIMTKDFGTQFAGTKAFQMNVADLPAGTYTLEFITNENRGVSKFTVTK